MLNGNDPDPLEIVVTGGLEEKIKRCEGEERIKRSEEKQEMGRKTKIAVILPGIGYHSDKPLLYYAKKLARTNGYEVKEVTYDSSLMPGEVKNEKKKRAEAIEILSRQAEEALSDIVWESYENRLFIGKSIGTVVAARYITEHKLLAKQIVLTPLPETFLYLKGADAVVLHGDKDPWCENDVVEEQQKLLGLPCHIYPDANHSLETGDPKRDVSCLARAVEEMEAVFIA